MSDKPKMVHLRVPASTRREVPEGALRLAEQRTSHLYRHVEVSIAVLLSNAYLQGVDDTVQVVERRHPELAAQMWGGL